MDGSQSWVAETIAEPDFIQAGDSDELLAIRLYEATQLGRKYVVVAYREISDTDGFILTVIQGYFILKTVFSVSRPNLQNRSA